MERVSSLIVNSFSTGISNTLARATARSNDGQCIPFVRAGAGSRARRNSHHSGADSGTHPAGHREGQGAGARRGPWPAAAARPRESMTSPLSDRLKDVQRQYAEMEHNTATLQNAQQAAWVAENNYRSLTDKCREEFRVRQGRDRKAASRGRPRPGSRPCACCCASRRLAPGPRSAPSPPSGRIWPGSRSPARRWPPMTS